MLRLGKISQVRLDINRMFILDMHLRFNAASNNQGAFLQEFFGNALADTGTCAGDNYHFIFNMGGVFNMCKAAVAELKKQEGSTIVTVGSDLGVRPIPERIGYCPSKAGVIMLTKCIALEYAPSIRANAILPGLVRTPMIEQRFTEAEDPAALEEAYASLYPLHKMGKVEDMANAAAFLSSDESGFMTGEIMHVCGGSLPAF